MIKNNLFLIIIFILALLAQLSLKSGADWLQYARPEIEAGQWWRFITGNFIHLNWRHLVLNALALVAIFYLFPSILSFTELLLVMLLSSIAVTLGLWLFNPSIYWYVGLSGALHGLLVTLLILDIAEGKSMLSIGLLILVLIKIVWEIWFGPLPGSEFTAGGRVVVEAHMFGSLGGLVLAVCIVCKNFNKNKKIVS